MAKTKMDQVEQIREKTGCTYEDAKKALDEANGDVLDAIIALEREGKVKTAATAQATTASATAETQQGDQVISADMQKAQDAYQESTGKGSFKKDFDNLWTWVKSAIEKSWEIKLICTREGKIVFTMPLIILILGLIFWGATIWMLIFGLIFGFRYHFSGLDKTTIEVDVNDLMDKAADKVDEIKGDFKKDE